MIQREITVANCNGFHLRPAALFTQTASDFQSTVRILYNGQKAEGRNLLEILKLGIEEGSRVTLVIDGSDEKEAMEELLGIFYKSI
ncbi:HPr family phosphocarrier protein [Effusibacillus consociatus]|uniref:HPr family phosphocarrier protein n=1 Tax=Effusibacillus consociatus TaxID=1117041 RepID=A0ABV9PYY3_9BACL